MSPSRGAVDLSQKVMGPGYLHPQAKFFRPVQRTIKFLLSVRWFVGGDQRLRQPYRGLHRHGFKSQRIEFFNHLLEHRNGCDSTVLFYVEASLVKLGNSDEFAVFSF